MECQHGEQPPAEATPVVFAVDEAFCLPLTVAWHSLKAANPQLARSLRIDVLFEELSAGALERLQRHADRLGLRLRLRQVALDPIDYPTSFGGAHANYLRLVIPKLYAECRRVLYLDADLLVLDDLTGLLNTDLGGAPMGAVRDPLNPLVGRGRALPGWSRLGVPPEREYFNSGVLVIDPEACLHDALFQRATEFIARHPEHIRLWDQDALNWAAEDRWHRLDACWNVLPLSSLVHTPWVRYTTDDIVPLEQMTSLEASAAILHFASPAKPWKGLLPAGPSASLYREFLDTVQDWDGEAADGPA